MELGFSMPALLQPALVEAMIHVNVSFLWLTARKRVFYILQEQRHLSR
jgi:hypothetical protein